jgi:flagellar basal body-associated protein FliL
MKRLAALLFLVILLGGGGAGGAWWFYLRETPSPDAAAAEDTGENAVRKRYIELEPIVFPIIREGQVILHLTLAVSLELDKPAPVDQISQALPRLQDAVFSELHAVFALRYVQERGYDLPIVQARTRLASERVLGAGAVKTVLIRNVSERKPRHG